MIPEPVQNLRTRREKLAATIGGSVPVFLQSTIRSDLKGTLSEHQLQRLSKGLSQKIIVYPETRGIYIADTDSTDDSYITSLNPATCTCSDFMYNCDYKSGERCKHAWKLRAMISIDALPASDHLPNLWTLAKIQEDLHSIGNSHKDFSEAEDRLSKLQAKLTKTEWYDIEYKPLYENWYNILENADLPD